MKSCVMLKPMLKRQRSGTWRCGHTSNVATVAYRLTATKGGQPWDLQKSKNIQNKKFPPKWTNNEKKSTTEKILPHRRYQRHRRRVRIQVRIQPWHLRENGNDGNWPTDVPENCHPHDARQHSDSDRNGEEQTNENNGRSRRKLPMVRI